MGINDTFSNLLKGAQSTVTTGIKTVQGLPGAIQTQTRAALSTAQRAVSQAVAQLPQPQSPAKSPARVQTVVTPRSTTQTQTSTRAPSSFEVASRATSRVARPSRAKTSTPTSSKTAQRPTSSFEVASQATAKVTQPDRAKPSTPAPTKTVPIPPSPFEAAVQATSKVPLLGREWKSASPPQKTPDPITQLTRAHVPIIEGVQRDLGRAVQSVSGVIRPPAPRMQSAQGTQRNPKRDLGLDYTRLSTQARRVDSLTEKHRAAVQRYESDPAVNQYKMKLDTYNQQVEAYNRAADRGRADPKTAAKLQATYQDLIATKEQIDARKKQELAEIQALEANIQMLKAPLQAELNRTHPVERPTPTPSIGSEKPVDPYVAARNFPFDAPLFRAVDKWVVPAATSVLKEGVVLPTDTETQYQKHLAADQEYQKLRQQYAGNFEGDTFVARNAQDMVAYRRLQDAADKVDRTGQAYEATAQKELLGVPAAVRGVGDWIAARDREVSETALRYVPQLKDAPKAAGTLRDTLTWTRPGTLGVEIGGRIARSVLGKSADESPTMGEYQRAMTEGVVEGWVHQPVSSLMWLGAGGVLGKGVGTASRVLGKASKAPGIARIIDPVKPTLAKGGDLTLKAVGAGYGADVGYRSIIDENGRIRPPLEQARELGRISAVEAVPMVAGAGLVPRLVPATKSAVAAGRRGFSSFRNWGEPPANIKAGGWAEPPESVLRESEAMRALRAGSPQTPSRYPKPRYRAVEVSPGKYVDERLVDSYFAKVRRDLDPYYLREYGVDVSPWRKPIPEEYLAADDIAEAYKFGGRGGVSLSGDPTPKAGWYPENWQIMEGLRMREAASPFQVARGGGSRYPKSRVEMVDIGGGRRVPKGELDNYLRQFEVETPQWRKPIPEEYLAAEDIAEAYKFGTPHDLLARVPPEFRAKWAPPQAYYAGIPVGGSRQALRPRFQTRPAPSSSSGRPSRVRPAHKTARPGGLLEINPLALAGGTTLVTGKTPTSRRVPAQEVLPLTDSLSVQRTSSILDFGPMVSPLLSSGVISLDKQGVLSVQEQDQRQRTLLVQDVGQYQDQWQGVLLTSDQMQGVRQTETLKQRQRTRIPPPRVEKTPPPTPINPPRREDKGRRRRRRKPDEKDHWEIGPAPGLAEMHGLIFGTPDRSPLDLGPPGLSVLNLGGSPLSFGQPSFGFAARAPARPPVIPSFGPPARTPGGSRTPKKAPGKKPAHAGQKPPAKKNQGILNDKPSPTTQKNSNARTTARTPDRRRDPAAGRNPARDARPGHRPAQKSARKRDQSK